MSLYFDQIQLKEAIIFASNGYTTIESIVKEDSSVLLGVLINPMPWQTAYCSDDQGNEGEDQYLLVLYTIVVTSNTSDISIS